MRRSSFCLPLALLALACVESERREAGVPGDERIPDPVPAADDRTAAPASAAVVPEFRLRLDPPRHIVEGTIELDVPRPETIHLLFRANWEGYPGLEARLRRLEARGPGGELNVAMGAGDLGAGHHLIEAPRPEHVTIRFTMVLSPASESQFYHRASQLGDDGGHLIGGDLLPRVWLGRPRGGVVSARIWFTGLPSNWRIATIEERFGTGYQIDDIIRSVFVVGQLRTQRIDVGRRSVTAAIHGRWPVPDDRVFEAMNRIAGNLHRIAGDGWSAGHHLVGAGRVPAAVPGWSTGGQVLGKSGIVYVGGKGPAEIEFRHWMYTTAHELMHWYIPIGFSFRQEPPRWFSEGFTDYMALKSLLVGELIGPQDFLDEIAERLARYRASPLYGTRSVVDAESDFWKPEVYRYIYDGGAAAAFLLDLGFQDRGRSVERALREIRRSTPVTEEVLRRELGAIRENEWIEDWLAGGDNPDWDTRLGNYRLAWRDGTLVSLDDWAPNTLSSIRP
jgi:predicted metalloprotease with PDZ domain